MGDAGDEVDEGDAGDAGDVQVMQVEVFVAKVGAIEHLLSSFLESLLHNGDSLNDKQKIMCVYIPHITPLVLSRCVCVCVCASVMYVCVRAVCVCLVCMCLVCVCVS